jgi:hypothetical protein
LSRGSKTKVRTRRNAQAYFADRLRAAQNLAFALRADCEVPSKIRAKPDTQRASRQWGNILEEGRGKPRVFKQIAALRKISSAQALGWRAAGSGF